MDIIAIAFFSTLTIGGLLWVFLYPSLSGEAKADKRKKELIQQKNKNRAILAEQMKKETSRKKGNIEDILAELESRQKTANNPSLNVLISQAGLKITRRDLFIYATILAVILGVATYAFSKQIIAAAAVAILMIFVIPRWYLTFMKKRRMNKFLEYFPDAVDVIVRGVKSGLPLGDCVRIISNEAQEPVKSEFKKIVETQAIGIPLSEACQALYERVPLAEAGFFGIVVSIQAKSGGSLSDSLGNLSKVLRDRKRMKAKIEAMSMEAKASAAIIAALPVAVMILIYVTSQNYIELLWTTDTGLLMLGGCAVLMLSGTLVMRKMINFDF